MYAAYNNALMMNHLPTYCSASKMFTVNRVPNCAAVISRFHVTAQVPLTTEAQKYSRIRLKRCFMGNLHRILRSAFVVGLRHIFSWHKSLVSTEVCLRVIAINKNGASFGS